MTPIRTFKSDRVPDITTSALREKADTTISVCIPCRNEVATIGPLVEAVANTLMGDGALVDELIVVDDRSTDGSATVAAHAGASVVDISEIHRVHGDGHGKGNVLWSSVLASRGDILVWFDADLENFAPDWVSRLVLPLLSDRSVNLVKASYDRSTQPGGGGRTTELVARPLLSLYFPELNGLAQPLVGEYAGRRSILETIPFVQGWGVEIAMLIDTAARYGPASIGQVPLGARRHRHRALETLGIQAAEVIAAVMMRTPYDKLAGQDGLSFTHADGTVVPLNVMERPPIQGLDAAMTYPQGPSPLQR